MIKVCYFTSKDANDIRVFHKECVSLVKAGYDVTMVCPNAEDKDVQGVHVRGVKYEEQGDFARFTKLMSASAFWMTVLVLTGRYRQKKPTLVKKTANTVC